MIGHDIIDLNYTYLPSRWKEERYWKKILSKEELNWVRIQDEPFIASQLLWAIKEANYKLLCKQELIHKFIPKKLVVSSLLNYKYYDSSYFSINSPWGSFISQAFVKDGRIEAYSAKNSALLGRICSQVFPSPFPNHLSQSKLIRRQLIDHLQSVLGEEKREVEIRKEKSIPKLYISDQQAPIDLSISHHGKWGSFAYVHTPL